MEATETVLQCPRWHHPADVESWNPKILVSWNGTVLKPDWTTQRGLVWWFFNGNCNNNRTKLQLKGCKHVYNFMELPTMVHVNSKSTSIVSEKWPKPSNKTCSSWFGIHVPPWWSMKSVTQLENPVFNRKLIKNWCVFQSTTWVYRIFAKPKAPMGVAHMTCWGICHTLETRTGDA